jgi:hypothetical protein
MCPIERGTSWLHEFQIEIVGGSAKFSSYFLITYVVKMAGEGCNLAPQDGCKGAKHSYPAIKLTVPQVVEND